MMLSRNVVEERKTNVECNFENKKIEKRRRHVGFSGDGQCLSDDDEGVLYNNIIYYYEPRAEK